MTQSEAVEHFRVIENMRLDRIKRYIDTRNAKKLPIDRPRRLIERRIARGTKLRAFDKGNGEKVLKRWLGLAASVNAKVEPKTLEQIIRLRPAVRDKVYSLVRRRPLSPTLAAALARAAESDLLIDDAAMVEMANHLVETFVRIRNSHAQIQAIIARNDQNSYYGLYSKLWLQSKYGTTAELLKTLVDTQSFWLPHERLGRLAASFLPLFYDSPENDAFRQLLGGSHNAGVREVYKFHLKLSDELPTFVAMYDALKEPNWSRGTGITHAKFLCLLSALRNTKASPPQKALLRKNNDLAFRDAYYKAIAKRLKV